MQETIDKAYYFDRNEFLVLLWLSGAKGAYSFPLPTKETFDKRTFLQSIYALTKRGFLVMEDKPVLSSEIKRLMGQVCASKLVINIAPKDEFAQKICYLSDCKAAVLELSGQSGMFRFTELPIEKFMYDLFEDVGLSRQPIVTEEEGVCMERYHECLSEERQHILALEERMPSPDFFAWAQEIKAQSAWEFFLPEQNHWVRRLLFIEGCMNTWVLDKTEKIVKLHHDSQQLRDEIQKFIRERL